MATGKVIGKLLKFKGFKAVDLAFKIGDELHIAVKPFKNGSGATMHDGLRNDSSMAG